MQNYRINTKLGLQDTNIKVKLTQTFDNLEILSLKINQENIYKFFTADYGVLIGRVIANEGLGVPNAKVSVFIPISEEDKEDEVISYLYPYSSVTDKNGDGVRYNLLPKTGKKITVRKAVALFPTKPTKYAIQVDDWVQVTINSELYWQTQLNVGVGPETPIGTFPSPEEIASDEKILYIYQKYFKYTTVTNESGDYMIFGIPVGQQIIHMDVDLSDIGKYSYSANTMISNGISQTLFTENNGIPAFKGSNNLEELPQIISQSYSVNIIPLWGDKTEEEIGITRHDFNIHINSEPIAYIVFNFAFDPTEDQNEYCALYDGQSESGNWDGSNSHLIWINKDGYIVGDTRAFQIHNSISVNAYRYNENNQKITGNIQVLSSVDLMNKGICILGVPCYSGRVTTDEFGNEIDAGDNRGVATKGKWQISINHNQSSNRFRNYSLQTAGSQIKDMMLRRDRVYTFRFLQRESFSLRNGGLKRNWVYGRPDGGWVNGLLYFGAGAFENDNNGRSKSKPGWLETGSVYNLETRIVDITEYIDKIIATTSSTGDCYYSNLPTSQISQEVSNLNVINTENRLETFSEIEPGATTTGLYSFFKGFHSVDAFKEVKKFLS